MSSDWGTAPLSEVATICKVRSVASADTGSDLPYLTAAVLRGGAADRYFAEDPALVLCLPSDSIVLCDGAGAGDVFPGALGVVASTMARLRPNNELVPRFFAYALQTHQDALRAGAQGTTVPHVNRDQLGDLPIPIPALSEQWRIADLLAAADIAVAAQARLVGARYAARSALLMDLLKNAAMSWTLGDVAEISIGRTPPRAEPDYWTTDLGRPFCSIADMTGLHVTPGREGITEKAVRDSKARLAPRGSLLMSFKLTVGRVGVAAVDLYPNEAIARIQPSSDRVSQDYLMYALQAIDYTNLTSAAVKGATLNARSLSALPIPALSIRDQRRVVDVVAAADKALSEDEGVLAAMRSAREQLLHDLLSGSHRIPDTYDELLERTP